MIAISDLRHKLVLEQIARVSDGGGGFTESWSVLDTLWAAISPISGRESVEADRITGMISHDIILRFRSDVTPSMRFRLGSRLFYIQSCLNIEERNIWLKCVCEERDL